LKSAEFISLFRDCNFDRRDVSFFYALEFCPRHGETAASGSLMTGIFCERNCKAPQLATGLFQFANLHNP